MGIQHVDLSATLTGIGSSNVPKKFLGVGGEADVFVKPIGARIRGLAVAVGIVAVAVTVRAAVVGPRVSSTRRRRLSCARSARQIAQPELEAPASQRAAVSRCSEDACRRREKIYRSSRSPLPSGRRTIAIAIREIAVASPASVARCAVLDIRATPRNPETNDPNSAPG